MSKNCKNCEWSTFGSSDASSDICDGCRNDPDTGWGGFTDHSIGKHFDNEEDRKKYLSETEDIDYDEDDMATW